LGVPFGTIAEVRDRVLGGDASHFDLAPVPVA
jgi:hypothetical protein